MNVGLFHSYWNDMFRYELVSGASEWFCDADETWKVRGRVVSRNDNNNYPECRPSELFFNLFCIKNNKR